MQAQAFVQLQKRTQTHGVVLVCVGDEDSFKLVGAEAGMGQKLEHVGAGVDEHEAAVCLDQKTGAGAGGIEARAGAQGDDLEGLGAQGVGHGSRQLGGIGWRGRAVFDPVFFDAVVFGKEGIDVVAVAAHAQAVQLNQAFFVEKVGLQEVFDLGHFALGCFESQVFRLANDARGPGFAHAGFDHFFLAGAKQCQTQRLQQGGPVRAACDHLDLFSRGEKPLDEKRVIKRELQGPLHDAGGRADIRDQPGRGLDLCKHPSLDHFFRETDCDLVSACTDDFRTGHQLLDLNGFVRVGRHGLVLLSPLHRAKCVPRDRRSA